VNNGRPYAAYKQLTGETPASCALTLVICWSHPSFEAEALYEVNALLRVGVLYCDCARLFGGQ
jgi:hypothetical protein